MTLAGMVSMIQKSDSMLEGGVAIFKKRATERTKEEKERVKCLELKNGKLYRVKADGK